MDSIVDSPKYLHSLQERKPLCNQKRMPLSKLQQPPVRPWTGLCCSRNSPHKSSRWGDFFAGTLPPIGLQVSRELERNHANSGLANSGHIPSRLLAWFARFCSFLFRGCSSTISLLPYQGFELPVQVFERRAALTHFPLCTHVALRVTD